MHRGGELAREGRDRENVLAAVAVLLVMLELQCADDVIAELQRHDHETLHLDGRVGDALVARHIVDDHRLAARGDGGPQCRRVLRRLPAAVAAALGSVRQRHHAFVQAVDAEIAPVHQPVCQSLDSLEGVVQADVRRDDGFHRVNLVQLLGGDRFFDHLFEQQPEEGQHHADEQPAAKGPADDHGDEDGGRE